ncbi:hypothetical protein [uncultured Chryseobacterium sp.]|uniref:hypothetical protein n=1 Tax=uncultured Chryseobacterium sp. TaxID=259322 RepID=UPI0025E2C2A3|nr:hypothetical protein [uncultured Chryseobacterium sp.]
MIREEYPFRKLFIYYKYRNNRISEAINIENGSVSKYSEFKYDQNGNKLVENWVSGNQKVRTYFKYNSKNKLIYEWDSCIAKGRNPNEYVEYLDRYYYNKQDSLIEKRQYGRILSKDDFKYRGKTTYEYKRIR